MPDGLAIKLKITGANEIRSALAGIRTSVQNRILKSAMTFAVTPLIPGERAAIPVESGTLKESIIKKVKQYKGSVFAVVGPDTKYKRLVRSRNIFYGPVQENQKPVMRRPAHYAHLVVGGTKDHDISVPVGKGGRLLVHHPGAKAHDFIKPVAAQKDPVVVDRFAVQVFKRIDAEYKKSVLKGKKFYATD